MALPLGVTRFPMHVKDVAGRHVPAIISAVLSSARVHEGTMFAVPFDRKRLEVTGSPTPVLEGITANPGDATMQVSFAENGTLLYVPGHSRFQLASIYWMDREGKFTPIRDTLTRLSFSGNNLCPIRTPDGRRVTYVHFEKQGIGEGDFYWTHADGTGSPLRLTETRNRKFPSSWHPSGKLLTFDQRMPGGNYCTLTIAIECDDKQGWKPGEMKPLVSASYTEWESSFLPDGRWLAYDSNETGDYEVYVRPFPGPGDKWQISPAGGRYPKWSRTSQELFYRTKDSKIMVAPYRVSGESFSPGKPQVWSPGQFTERIGSVNFDTHPDGKRAIVLKAPPSSETSVPSKFTFVFNFFEELRRKSPSGN